MPQSATQVGSDNEAILFQLAEVLGEHFLGCFGKYPAQFAQTSWSMLKLGQNSHLPFSLNEIDCELR